MIILISPAKSLEFEISVPTNEHTIPEHLESAGLLIEKLRNLSVKQIGKLMSISPALSELNAARYAAWTTPFNSKNAKQALFVFRGDVYRGMDAASFNNQDVTYAQQHLRILSGLYGVIRPLDLIQPYRLEMGSKLKVTAKIDNLYKFWGDRITTTINEALAGQKDGLLVNLASNEYYKAVHPKKVKGRIISPNFMDMKNGSYKSIMTYAKIARGLMAAYLIKNRIETADGIKGFDSDGYVFNEKLSEGDNWVFTRG